VPFKEAGEYGGISARARTNVLPRIFPPEFPVAMRETRMRIFAVQSSFKGHPRLRSLTSRSFWSRVNHYDVRCLLASF